MRRLGENHIESSWVAQKLADLAAVVDDQPAWPVELDEGRAWRVGWRGLVIVLLAVGAYAATLGGGWLWGDDSAVLNDLRLRSGRGLAGAWRAWGAWGAWGGGGGAFAGGVGPGEVTLRWVQWRVFGDDPAGWRGTGLAMHALTCVGLWRVLRRWGAAWAWGIAAVVAVHPVMLPQVAWVSRQGDVLATLLAVGAVACCLRARGIEPPAFAEASHESDEDHPPHRLLGGAFVVCCLGVLVTCPVLGLAVAGLIAMVLRGRGQPPERSDAQSGEQAPRLRRVDAIGLAGLATLSLAGVGLQVWRLAGEGALPDLPWLAAAGAPGWTIYKTLVPYPLPVAYDASQVMGQAWFAIIGGGAAAAVLAFVVVQGRWGRTLVAQGAAGLLLVGAPACIATVLRTPTDPQAVPLATLLPYPLAGALVSATVAGVIAGFGAVRARRGIRRPGEAQASAALVGSAVSVSSIAPGNAPPGIKRLPATAAFLTAGPASADAVSAVSNFPPAIYNPYSARPSRAWRWAAGVTILGVFGGMTLALSPAWADATAQWQAAVAAGPSSAFAREQLADRYAAQGRFADAAAALDATPEAQRDVRWLIARGTLEQQRAHPAEAVGYLTEAHWRAPASLAAGLPLGQAYIDADNPRRALLLYTDLARQHPDNAPLQNTLGLTHLRLGQPAAAIPAYRKSIATQPDQVPARINLANALFATGQLKQAADELQQVIKIDPRNYPAFLNAGVMLYQLGDMPAAERMFRAAVQITPTSADAFDKLGITLAAQKRYPEAAWCFGQAIEIEPGNAEAVGHLEKLRGKTE